MRASADPDSIADALLVHARDPAARTLPAIDPSSRFELCARLALGKPVAFGRDDLRQAEADGALRAAALRFIARTQFAPDADHYTLLGLTPNAAPQSIRDRHRLLMQIVHPDRTPRDVRWPEGLAARVNRAYGTLKDPQQRAAYDRERRAPAMTYVAYVAYAAHAGRPATTAAIGRRTPPPDLDRPLPEWLTYGVGGFIRRNPATVIFALLISVCSVAIATVAFVDQGARLHRDRGRESPTTGAGGATGGAVTAGAARFAPATAAAFGPAPTVPAPASLATLPAAAPTATALPGATTSGVASPPSATTMPGVPMLLPSPAAAANGSPARASLRTAPPQSAGP